MVCCVFIYVLVCFDVVLVDLFLFLILSLLFFCVLVADVCVSFCVCVRLLLVSLLDAFAVLCCLNVLVCYYACVGLV